MTNGKKYKTAEERSRAYNKYLKSIGYGDDVVNQFAWLDLESEADEEKPMPCPFCGRRTSINYNHDEFYVKCFDTSKPIIMASCGYVSEYKKIKHEAIAAHNRICKAVAAYKESEVTNA